MTQSESGQFKDSTGLTKWMKWLLYAQIIISIIAVISGGFEYKLLSDMQKGSFQSVAQLSAAADASDQRQQFIGIMQIVIFSLVLISYFMWVYRANFNARQIGAQGMKVTPGWSVGWYFVPIWGLWKPYVAMKEIWKASLNPKDWHNQQVPALLGWWWFFWLLTQSLSMQSFKLSAKAEEISQMIFANVVTIGSDVLEIPLSLIMIALISKIYKMQMSHYQESIEERQQTDLSNPVQL